MIYLHCWPHIYLSHWPSTWSSVVATGFLLPNIPLISKNSLQLHSTIDRPLIHPQLTWSYCFNCQLIHISDPIYIYPTDLVPGLLLSSLVFCYQIFIWFSKISFHLHSTIDRPLINPQLPWSSSVNFLFICTSEPVSITRSHQPVTWYAAVVTGLLLSNLPLIFENFPCTCTPQLIDPWLILNYPGLLMLISNWFASLTTDLSLAPTDPFIGMLLSSMVFCYQIFLWFSEKSLHLHSPIDRPPNQSSITLVFCYWLLID